MWGAILGDIAGSRFEWNRIKTKDFDFFGPECEFTDDSVCTAAVAEILLDDLSPAATLRNCTPKSREWRRCAPQQAPAGPLSTPPRARMSTAPPHPHTARERPENGFHSQRPRIRTTRPRAD